MYDFDALNMHEEYLHHVSFKETLKNVKFLHLNFENGMCRFEAKARSDVLTFISHIEIPFLFKSYEKDNLRLKNCFVCY